MDIINQNLSIQTGDRVRLYDDTSFTGTVVRAILNTYPQRWTVQLDDGQYLAAIERNIFRLDSEITASTPETELNRLREENSRLKREIDKLNRDKESLTEELEQIKDVLRQAKDTSPVLRPSIQRVLRMAREACLDLIRTTKGWALKLGDKVRQFYHLTDVWYFLTRKEWDLAELFPPEATISASKIVLPKPKPKKVTPLKSPYREPLLTPREILRRREIEIVTSTKLTGSIASSA